MPRNVPRHAGVTLLGLVGIALSGPAAASAQMWFFPDRVAFGVEEGSDTYLAPSYGRRFGGGGEGTNSLGLTVGHVRPAVYLSGSIGRLNASGETLLGAQVGVTAIRTSAVEVTVQGGMGWVDFEGGTISAPSGSLELGTIKSLRFPVGVALRKRTTEAGSLFVPWVMPLLEVRRTAQSEVSQTSVNGGMAAGLWVGSEQGFGFYSALEAIRRDGSTAWHAGLGFYWTFDGLRTLLR